MLPEEEDYTPASGYFFQSDRYRQGGGNRSCKAKREVILQSKPDSSKTFFWSYMLPAESFDTATPVGQKILLFPSQGSHTARLLVMLFLVVVRGERERSSSKDLAGV
ncbi:hypothetical protein KC19_4G229000 [Ceratodon purpureus]|uniref:Uncharacterized protein n=1 Tax=Ceratodon purpureus TaxID=3225 RepID=A0A8T0IE54_CERPU|nr:hypothetical protein KC19_4G229000 [Ceratodon purpureus]